MGEHEILGNLPETIKFYWDLFWRHKWIILGIMFLIMIPLVTLILKQSDVYQSRVQLMMELNSGSSMLAIAQSNISKSIYNQDASMVNRLLGAYQTIINSDSYNSAISKTYVNTLEHRFDTQELQVSDSLMAMQILNDLSGNIHLVASEENMGILTLVVNANTPQSAKNIANIATDIFNRRVTQLRREEFDSIVDFISEQLENTIKDIEEVENELQTFRHSSGAIMNADGVPLELVTLQDALIKTKAQLELYEAELGSKKKILRETNSDIVDTKKVSNPTVTQLQTQLYELEEERIQLLNIDKPIELQNLDKQIESLKEEVSAQILTVTHQDNLNSVIILNRLEKEMMSDEVEINMLRNRTAYYQNMINHYEKTHPKIVEATINYTRLLRVREFLMLQYKLLLSSLEQAKIEAASQFGNVRILEPANLPKTPINSDKSMKIVMSFIFALILGVAVSIFREVSHNTFHNSEQFKKRINAPFLGLVPFISSKDTPSLLINELFPTHPITEAYKGIITNLTFTCIDSFPRLMMITSAWEKEGKSLTSANLALACAGLGKKTLLIDLDLRRPQQNTYWKLQDSKGFSDMLAADTFNFDFINQVGDNCFLLTAGSMTPDPLMLLNSKRAKDLLEILLGQYEQIIIDTPPILGLSDSYIISALVEGVIMVARARKTEQKMVIHAYELLKRASANIVGTILNDVDLDNSYSIYDTRAYYYYHRENNAN